MKYLVVPDAHLKTQMLDMAEKILKKNPELKTVFLGDYLDDFYKTKPDYDEFMTRLRKFKHDFPDSDFLWGNHEISYLLGRPVTGSTRWGENAAKIIEEEFNPKFVHLEGNVIYSHAGIFNEWLMAQGIDPNGEPVATVKLINQMPYEKFWRDNSLIWARPQHENYHVAGKWIEYKQVIGHTPLKEISDDGLIISTDVFSTNWGKKFGEENFIIIDTATGEWVKIS